MHLLLMHYFNLITIKTHFLNQGIQIQMQLLYFYYNLTPYFHSEIRTPKFSVESFDIAQTVIGKFSQVNRS